MKDDKGSDIGMAGVHRQMHLPPHYVLSLEHILGLKGSRALGLARWGMRSLSLNAGDRSFIVRKFFFKIVKKIQPSIF